MTRFFFWKLYPETGISILLYFCKGMINNCFFRGMVFGWICQHRNNMKTNPPTVTDQLNTCLKEREQIADALQNEVNQTLASVLLWIQFTRKDNNLAEDKSFQQAEINLKAAIDRVRMLHYSLTKMYD